MKKYARIEPSLDEKSAQKLTTANEKSFKETKHHIEYFIAIKRLKFQEPATWIGLFVFIWPLPFLMLKKMLLSTKWKKRISDVIEFLLAVLSVYFIYLVVFRFWYKPMFAGYITIICFSLYLFLHVFELLTPIVKFRR